MSKKKKNSKPGDRETRAMHTPARREKYLLPLLAVLAITFVAYLPVLNNGFVNLDDDKYILENTSLSSLNLGNIFSSFVQGNYHPLTMLVFSVEFRFFGLNPSGYHLVSLFLHLANVLLVFHAILRISKQPVTALAAALLFGIHPFHVESVAWASELKDLLYTLFFLASWLLYLKYLDSMKTTFIFLALISFLLSLFSKGMAVSLPVVLLLTDYLRKRKFTAKSILEKAPFFALAILFGAIAIMAQKSSGSIQDLEVFPLGQRIVFACYGFVNYLLKLAVPFHLSAFYPYPVSTGESIPATLFFYSVILVFLASAVTYSLRFTRKIAFGALFFSVTVFLVLQLLPVGGAIMADRYSYIPSIGIFYLAGELVNHLLNRAGRNAGIKPAVILFSLLIAGFYSVTTYDRCIIWESGMSLWNDVILKEPTVSLAYNNRAALWIDEKKYREAEEDYNKAVGYRPSYAEAYQNRGVLLAGENRYEEALKDYTKAIELKPGFTEAHNNRGMLLMSRHQYDQALQDFNRSIELSPAFATAYNNRGNLYLDQQKYDLALLDYNKTTELDPGYVKAYNGRGVLYMRQNKYDAAIAEYTRAIGIQPDYGEGYCNRAIAYYNSGKKEPACRDLQDALRFGFSGAESLHNQWCR